MLRWRLAQVLDAEGITVYQLHQIVKPHVSSNTLYSWSKRAPKLLDPEKLAWVLWGLARLTGKPYVLADLIELDGPSYQPKSPAPKSPELDAELRSLLRAAGKTRIVPPRGEKPAGMQNPPKIRGVPISQTVIEQREERDRTL